MAMHRENTSLAMLMPGEMEDKESRNRLVQMEAVPNAKGTTDTTLGRDDLWDIKRSRAGERQLS